MHLLLHFFSLSLYLATVQAWALPAQRCRNQPGDPGFPNSSQWQELNDQVGGRLVEVVPSAKYCHSLPSGNCTEDQWISTTFRGMIPGAMDEPDWEQDYLSDTPSLCLQNGTTCDQGNVPLYAVNVTSVADIQAAVRFASQYNIRVAIKASGHDFLGRSTAKNSLLIWTHYLRNLTFTDSFYVADKNLGGAVTVGSGVPLNALYTATKAQDKMVVGGTAATVVAAGGYVQGAGHSAFSPLLGLASDNVLEFNIVVANGSFIVANESENPDLFWALRGGGAGSWGVIVSATFRTYPTFYATRHLVAFNTGTNASSGQLATIHAQHIFDWDWYRASQYFYVYAGYSPVQPGGNIFIVTSYFPNTMSAQADAAMKPFIDDATAAGFSPLFTNSSTGLANDLVYSDDDELGLNAAIGSRLIPAAAYRNNASAVGDAYVRLLELGVTSILAHVVAGGQVSENANIYSAVNPKWRAAKAHVIATTGWSDSAPPAAIEMIKARLSTQIVPILANLTQEHDSGAYSNEADVREIDFQTTFFGPNYGQLEDIKQVYDPDGLFIVQAGVGSQRWDNYGLCKIGP